MKRGKADKTDGHTHIVGLKPPAIPCGFPEKKCSLDQISLDFIKIVIYKF